MSDNDWEDAISEIHRRREAAGEQGGSDAVERQHGKGRLTVRERIDALVDAGSFREVGPIAGGAERDEQGRMTSFTPGNYVLGFGRIEGRPCVVGGEDFTMAGGSPNVAGLRKSVYTEQVAQKYRVPLIRLHEGAGGSVTGSGGKGGGAAPPPSPVYEAHRFASVGQTLASVPVAAAALGATAGMPAGRLVSSHYCVMTRETAQVLIGGPALVERALGRETSKEELGGPEVHERSGVVDDVVDDEQAAFTAIRRFLGYLPRNVWELPPVIESGDPRDRQDESLAGTVPANRRRVYDMRAIVRSVLDQDSFFEMGRGHGRGQITGFARLTGIPVGVLGNDCRYLAGAMTADGARKVRRFIELCQVFHLPIVSFVDEPGFMIGPQAERDATMRFGAAAILAAALCTVPWASLIVRKSMGLASAVHYGQDAYVLAWPSAETGALPVEGGVAVAFRREIAAAPEPEAKRRELEEQLAKRQSPFPRADAFSVHDLIDPRETRPRLCDWIELAHPLLRDQLGPTAFSYRP
ncbi:MAG TPA: carboxyl transferase domain-containing protein [Gammaproteobacteria bacterium]|nr:carboxyl transferase domain-containing protein [Gammaproteobacteria bacterium]